MLRIPCPKCKKSTYTSNVEPFLKCPYCGFTHSGKFGPDRRREPRTEREVSFILSYMGRNFEASTFDFSIGGVGIKVFGEPHLATDDVLDLIIDDLYIVAKVMWVKRFPDKALAGLLKVN